MEFQARWVPAAELRAQAWNPKVTAGEGRGLRRYPGKAARGQITAHGMWAGGKGQSRRHMSGCAADAGCTTSSGGGECDPLGAGAGPRRGGGGENSACPVLGEQRAVRCGAIPGA